METLDDEKDHFPLLASIVGNCHVNTFPLSLYDDPPSAKNDDHQICQVLPCPYSTTKGFPLDPFEGSEKGASDARQRRGQDGGTGHEGINTAPTRVFNVV